MMTGIQYTDYDRFAWVYNKHWNSYSVRVISVLEKLLLSKLPAGARILDLCCGTGQLAAVLSECGYQVTGVDGSPEMLCYARENAPHVEFIASDARTFKPVEHYHAVVSVFDSLNHLMTLEELTIVFKNVYGGLLPGGMFVFDLNMEAAYLANWRGSFSIVEADHAIAARSGYDENQKEGYIDFTLFKLEDGWQRSDVRLTQRCYPQESIEAALKDAGFVDVQSYDAENDLDFRPNIGRSFFACRK
jgi:SAM-dependent methyltransferase